MSLEPTSRLYLQDDHCIETEAIVLAILENGIAFNQTCFHPGGGGQPPDEGAVTWQNGETLETISIRVDGDDVLWHICREIVHPNRIGEKVHLAINRSRRLRLMCYHTILHVLNTIALRDYNGWITGVQINTDYSRIDFKLENFTPVLAAELEEKVNIVLQQDHALRAYYITEEEFRQRTDLLRNLNAKPPIVPGQVRVVEIEGFDAQACGGTHVRSTREVGRFSIFRTDNKGRNNKRFYVRLEER